MNFQICKKNLYSPTSPEQEARQEQELRAMNQIHLMFNEIENIGYFTTQHFKYSIYYI